jgi:hypothetical protein
MENNLAVLVLATLLAAGCGPSVPANGGDPPIPECAAELDGALTVAELPLAPGLEVRYTRNAPDDTLAFDVDGSPATGDRRAWDFSEGPTDVGATFGILDPADTPCADLFDDVSYAAPILVETPELLGCFRRTVADDGSGELSVLGMVTSDGVAPAAATRLVYDEPLVLHRFPMRVGDSWEQTVHYRSAVAYGVPNQGLETYRFEVDALGTAAIPGGIQIDDVLRLRVDIEQTLALAVGDPTRSIHQLLWVRPCFGEIARVVSTDPDLAEIDELRRYYP